MSIKVSFSLLGLAVLLTGCLATTPKLNLNDSQAIASAISVRTDSFKKQVNFSGPNVAKDETDDLHIRAWKFEKTGDISYQIYIADYYYGDWRFYDAAYDSNGDRFDTTKISREVGSCNKYGCSHVEHLGLNVSKQYLEKNASTGISFKVSGKAGEQVFYIPSAYVQAILQVVK